MIYDIGIIGTGVAGTFACLKLARDHKDQKVLAIEVGSAPMKRRSQCHGWMGILPTSDGKFYQSNLEKVSILTGPRKTSSANKWFRSIISELESFSDVNDTLPNENIITKLNKIGYEVSLNNYFSMIPKSIHALSRHFVDIIEEAGNIDFSFNNEVNKIYKQKGIFILQTDEGEFKCKKLMMAVGRGGWRWARDIYDSFGIIDNNDIARFGIRVEMPAQLMENFNNSNCTLRKNNEIEIGPLSWGGTIIPEDHQDVAISAFRSNEKRWETDKVSFSLIGNRKFVNYGFEQTDRISKLTFVLANDRIIKEKISNIMTNKSKISIIPEYNWIKEVIEELSQVIPEIASKAYYHVPTITPLVPTINIASNLETDVKNMFVVGESAGIIGLLAAATTGIIGADQICK